MTTNNFIYLKQLVADPIAYIDEMIEMHPGSEHNKDAGSFIIQNEIIQSALRYRWIEEGLFLFCFESFSPIDAHFEFVANPTAEYYSMIFYFTEASSNTPFYVKTTEGVFSDDQCALFFNPEMSAEIFLKANHKAFGIRLDIHQEWIRKNISEKYLQKNSIFTEIFSRKKTSYTDTNCRSFESQIISVAELVKNTDTVKATDILKIRSEVLIVIVDFTDFLNSITQAKSGNKSENNLVDNSLQNALKHMKTHIYKKFPGSSILAESCGLSESNFSKKFKHTFHKSASAYFKEMQMKEAATLLKLGKRVKDVAHKLGYQNVASFGRAYKLVFGKSPASSVH